LPRFAARRHPAPAMALPSKWVARRVEAKLDRTDRTTPLWSSKRRFSNMDLDLKSRTALVSGASIGIGRAIAKALALEGVRVVAVARRKDLLATLEQESRTAGGGSIIPVVQDLMQEDAATKLAATAVAEIGHIDILVNNAGGSRPLPVDAPDSDWDEAMALNFTRYRQVTHALLPQMIERGWGRIINVTGKSEPEGLNAAFSAKAAVHAWAKGLSREIGRHGITVNCIPPGRIMSEQIRRNYPEDYRTRFAEEEIPVGYWGEPEDLAALAVFLASPVARYITGAVIPVDGGLRRYQF
jgi:3-oxoacyl-[acyl-carrier protein] reductase